VPPSRGALGDERPLGTGPSSELMVSKVVLGSWAVGEKQQLKELESQCCSKQMRKKRWEKRYSESWVFHGFP